MFLSHAAFMALVILYSHHPSFVVPLFLLFLGWVEVTKEYQTELKLRESLLVAFFLGGLVILGKLQGWWLRPLLESLNEGTLFSSALVLTAVTDNAALTYLGTLVSSLTEKEKIMLVAGAVSGGGLTVIANAPNPIGFRILKDSFGSEGISPWGLFLGALPYTVLVALVFMIFD